MWKTIGTVGNSNGDCVRINKSFHRGKGVYSIAIGFEVANGSETKFSPFVRCKEDVGDTALTVHALIVEAAEVIERDKAQDREIERQRQDALAGKGREKNPQANSGLSRFKKREKAVKPSSPEAAKG